MDDLELYRIVKLRSWWAVNRYGLSRDQAEDLCHDLWLRCRQYKDRPGARGFIIWVSKLNTAAWIYRGSGVVPAHYPLREVYPDDLTTRMDRAVHARLMLGLLPPRLLNDLIEHMKGWKWCSPLRPQNGYAKPKGLKAALLRARKCISELETTQ